MCTYRNHLQSVDDLVTTYEATRAGFVALAIEKNRRATPYIAEARALQEAAAQAENPTDLCLFNLAPTELVAHKSSAIDPSVVAPYVIALGELKGGIDPAGADEHWKTAQAALNRIREAFSRVGHSPFTFFVSSAVARRMAGEIWDQLENGTLSNAANLNEENQVASISRWLCNL